MDSLKWTYQKLVDQQKLTFDNSVRTLDVV